uniref:Putative ixostatin n=1 Tax=Ixodes ricinus TaxID=34613 RepID=A0A0K8R3U7_IXORI
MKLAAGVIIVALLILILEEEKRPNTFLLQNLFIYILNTDNEASPQGSEHDISSEFIASGHSFQHMTRSDERKLKKKLNKACGYPRFSFTEIDFSGCRYKCRGIGTDPRTATVMLDDGTLCGGQGVSCKGGHCVAEV